VGGPQRWSEHGGEEKNSKPLPGPKHPNIQPTAQRHNTDLLMECIPNKFNLVHVLTSHLLTYLLTYLLTHSLTPWCSIFFEKLIACQTISRLLYGTRRFTTVLTKVRNRTTITELPEDNLRDKKVMSNRTIIQSLKGN
jgi:hypothetical protein